MSEKITGKEVKKPSQKEDEKDFVQNTTSSKTPDEQTLLSPFERGVEPEFAYVFNFFSLCLLYITHNFFYELRYEDTAIDNITGS